MQNGDIFKWSYNAKWLKKKNDGNNNGTTYWCDSRIGVFNDGVLVDTFWGGSCSSNDTSFTVEMIESMLEVEFIANEDDLISAQPSERAYYLDSDCVDLNHPNSTRGNFYLRKGAKKNVEKMERILKRERNNIASSIRFQLRSISQLDEQLKNVTDESYVHPTPESISLCDTSWEDYEAEVSIESKE